MKELENSSKVLTKKLEENNINYHQKDISLYIRSKKYDQKPTSEINVNPVIVTIGTSLVTILAIWFFMSF